MTQPECDLAASELVRFAEKPSFEDGDDDVAAEPQDEPADAHVPDSAARGLRPPGAAAAVRELRARAAALGAAAFVLPKTAEEVAKHEMTRYLVEFAPIPEAGQRPYPDVEFWNDTANATRFPTLRRAWQVIGRAPPTQASCERFFSICGSTLSSRRSRLSPESAGQAVISRLEADMMFPRTGSSADAAERWDTKEHQEWMSKYLVYDESGSDVGSDNEV
eukprot:TRINITY_DN163_c0_g2_i4.p1 TRINITY_DN163_c0_g2~~TRINITY_DN163_c0_g2_i4.p1  ORF type:complete len:220 (+),score=22.07 TRINITY_DN163_c0_g2_i4:774-1433(+)